MTPNDACTSLQERSLDVLEGGAPELAEHARACGPCTRVLARERRLLATLEALAPAPEFDVTRPALPAGRVLHRPLFRAIASAAAAALLMAAGSAFWQPEQVADVAPTGTAVAGGDAVGSLEDVTTLLDDDLLALTMGHEAVVMQRPTER